MKVIIKEMTLINFKGHLGEKTYKFKPERQEVYGKNRSGKTTLADAFRWCLFGKNSEGAAVFGIKTKTEDGKVIPNLDHEVRLLLNIDGQDVEIRKVLQEKWGKLQGSSDTVLTGHTTTYFVDGSKLTEKKYKEFIDTWARNESMFMCITSPTHFTSLKPDTQRELLAKMVEERSIESIAHKNAEFESVLKDMRGKDIETYINTISYQIREVKDELQRIPIRINEQKQEIANIDALGIDFEQVKLDIEEATEELKRIDEAIADKSKVVDRQYELLKGKREALRELQEQQDAIRHKHNSDFKKEMEEHDYRLVRLRTLIANEQEDIVNIKNDIREYTQLILSSDSKRKDIEDEYERRKAEFRTRWSEAKSEQFVYDEDSSDFVCPTCKRRLEEDDIQAAIQRLHDNFNNAHAAKMEKLKKEAERIKQDSEEAIAAFEKSLTLAKQARTESETSLDKHKSALSDKHAEELKLSSQTILTLSERIAADSEYQRLEAEICAARHKLEEQVQMEGTTETDELRQQKEAIMRKRDELNARYYNKAILQGKHKRIKELEEQECALNAQLTELEHKDHTAHQLLEASIEDLESRVNSLFSIVKFNMFDKKINGSMKPTCECCVGGVPFSDLNSAARINAGIDIINAICRHMNMYAPCFIDNAESINNVMRMASQQILLTVSKSETLVFA